MKQKDCCPHAESELYDKDVFEGALTRVLGKEHGAAGNHDKRRFRCCLCSAAGEWASHLGCGHVLAVDTDRLELYCQQCRDYMYLEEFDEALLLVKHHLTMQQPESCHAKPCYIPDNDPATNIQAKRRKLKDAAEPQRRNSSSSSSSTCLAAAPDGGADMGSTAAAGIDGAEAVLSCMAAGSCSALLAGDGFPLGLRGLNNLGNTCFMNSVIQVMLHAPLLSSFFLGEGHDPTTCWLTACDRPCLACQMDAMFAEMHSGSHVPFSPSEFLYHWWRHADSLAGYQQQDAHEFYLSLLEGMAAATIATQQQQQDKQQTPADDVVAPQLQQSPVGVQAGISSGGAVGNGAMLLQPFPAGAAAQEGGGAGLDVLGRPTASAGHQLWAQQQQLALHLRGGLDLHLQGGNGDWQQFSLQQLLQQHGLDGWAHAYGGLQPHHQSHNQQQQQQQDNHVSCAGPTVTPEPCTADVTPEPAQQGHTDGGEGLVELLFSGLLRSDVRCCACGHTSTAHDPFRDISLDLHVPRPPKLPPPQPLNRTQAAAAATAAKAAVAASQEQQTVAGVALPAAAAIGVVSPAPHGSATAADSSCVSGGGVLGREVTPPLLLVTPSPTPPPSELLGDFWDNADDEAAGQLGISRLHSPAAGTYSAATSLCTKAESPSAATSGGGGDHEGVCSDGVGSPGVDGTSQLSPAADGSTGTSVSRRECAVNDVAAVSGPSSAADQYSGDASPHSTDGSELGGAAASQSSQQMGGADTSALTGSGLTRDTTPEPASTTDTAAAAASHNTPQQQQCAGAGMNRESTPQSQQHAPPAVHNYYQQQDEPAVAAAADQGGVGAASGLVCGVGGGLGHLVRAPVAAIKQLLPAWSAASHHQQQQPQQQQRLASAGAHYANGVGDSMGALPQQQQQQAAAGGWHSADLQEWQQQQPSQQDHQHQQQQHGKLRLVPVEAFSSGAAPSASRSRGSKRGSAAAGPKARQQRCGSCKYCLNRHLKKGCEANKKLLEEAKKTAAAPKHHRPQHHHTGTTAPGGDLLRPTMAAATTAPCAVPFGGPDSAATQPVHPLGGMHQTQYPQQQQYQQQQQCPQQQQYPQQQQQQHVPHQPDWLAMHQPHSMQQYPDHWHQHQQQQRLHQPSPPPATAAAAVQKARRSPKPAGSSMTELLAAAALQQGLMKKRDGRGRFYRKEDLQAWALQLYEEGRLTAEGLPAVTHEAAAAARARGWPEPPAALAAQTTLAAAAAPHAGPWGTERVSATKTAGGADVPAKAGKSAGVRKGSGSNTTVAAGAAKKPAPPPPQLRMNELSLAGCLRRFVRPERLGPSAQWRCSGCGSTAAALKQMSIRRLPLVLCFHMKRFEHGGAAGRAKKLDVPMRFPLKGLDMAPFTTREVLLAGLTSSTSTAAAGAHGAAVKGEGTYLGRVAAGAKDSSVTDGQPAAGVSYHQQCLYELFGVVSHSGDMASGHYVSFVKCEGCWYLINDPWVVAVAESDVVAAQAYMLFYAQQQLFCTGASSELSSGGEELATAAAEVAGNTVVHVKQEPTSDSVVVETTAQTVA